MSYHPQHQILHSSVLPTLVHSDTKRKPRPVSVATSIASSVDLEDDAVHQMSQTRLSKAPVYHYSSYDMELQEDEDEEDILEELEESEDGREDEEIEVDRILGQQFFHEQYQLQEETDEDEEDDDSDHMYDKTRRMTNWLAADGARDSVGSDGMKTASSYDEARTPTTPPIDYGGPKEMSTRRGTVGPRGPHLFSSLFIQTSPSNEALDEYATPISPIKHSPMPYDEKTPVQHTHSFPVVPQSLQKQQSRSEIDINERPVSAMSMLLEELEESEVESWSTTQVCDWMRELGFEEALIQKLRQNDISGAILMKLTWEDLKELDIQSFGKRIELWSELNHLRKSPVNSTTSPKRELSFETSSVHSPPLLSQEAMRKTRESKLRQSSVPSRSPVSFSPISPLSTVASGNPITSGPRKLPVLKVATDVASLQAKSAPRLHVSAPAEDPSYDMFDVEEGDEDSEDDDDEIFSPDEPTFKATIPMEEQRRPFGLSIIIPNSALAIPKPLGSAESRSSRGSEGRKQKPAHFSASKSGKKRVQMNRRLSTPLSPVSPASFMGKIDIFAAPSVVGTTNGKRASMLECESPRWANGEAPEVRWAPSICASSDVLSPTQRGDMRLKTDELRKVSVLSAQEQVNKFLTLQHLQKLEDRNPPSLHIRNESNKPGSPLSPKSSDPILAQMQKTVAPPAPVAPAVNAINPFVQRSTSMRTPDRHRPGRLQLSKAEVAPGPATAGFVRPGFQVGDFQPLASPRNIQTIPENASSNMAAKRAPSLLRSITEPSPVLTSASSPTLVRSATTVSPKAEKAPAAPRAASFAGNSKKVPSLGKSLVDTVNEEAEWEDSSEHGSRPASPGERAFIGEMKKRTNHWMRNEWNTHRVELHGTRLTVYKTTSSREVSCVLEIDDYNVTCTSAGSNKFGNSIKSLKAGGKKDSDGMYHFQLVPIHDSKKSVSEPKKEHHFAVSSREERIDWMRELMLAKAIKQKKSGFQVEVNGKMI